jgi:cell division septation protein DedD
MTNLDKDNLQEENDTQNKKSFNLSFWIVLTSLVLSLLALSWYYYSSYKGDDNQEILVIAADEDDIKIAPDEPGGMVVENMDKVVYDAIGSGEKESDKIERVLPPVEEPIDKSSIKVTNSDNVEPLEQKQEKFKNILQEEPTKELEKKIEVKQEEKKPALAKIHSDSVAMLDNTTSNKNEQVNQSKKKAYHVQIASLKSQTAAEKEWDMLSKKFAKIIKNYKHYIITKTIEGKGTFYRLQIGPFNDEKDARKTCNALKEAGAHCFLIKP